MATEDDGHHGGALCRGCMFARHACRYVLYYGSERTRARVSDAIYFRFYGSRGVEHHARRCTMLWGWCSGGFALNQCAPFVVNTANTREIYARTTANYTQFHSLTHSVTHFGHFAVRAKRI